ncbi:MAG: hypothetical protein IKG83_03320 [Prevotella sp.]|nr:hypothetical protein [Prevotella sp.]
MDYITTKLLKKCGFGCPICGQADNLTVTSKGFYDELVAEHGSAMVSVECHNCNLELNQYGEANEKYDSIIQKIWDKWCSRNYNRGVEA